MASMRRRPHHRIAVVAAIAAVLGGALAAPAGASSRVDFELSPVDGGSYPRFTAHPGQTVSGAVRLRSHAGKPTTIRLQALDLQTADTGGIEFEPGRANAVGSWLTLQQRDVRLPARSTRIVRFTASVPADAPAGEHFAGLIAIDRGQLRSVHAPATGRGVELREIARVALPVRLRLLGPATRKLALRGAAFAADAGGSRLELDLRSVGHLLIRGTDIDVRVSDSKGRELFRHHNQISEFVPQSSIRYPIAWRGIPAAGEYRVRGTIKPRGANAVHVDERVAFEVPQARELERRTGTAAPDSDGARLLLFVALGAALVFGGAASAGYLRLRRRLGRATD